MLCLVTVRGKPIWTQPDTVNQSQFSGSGCRQGRAGPAVPSDPSPWGNPTPAHVSFATRSPHKPAVVFTVSKEISRAKAQTGLEGAAKVTLIVLNQNRTSTSSWRWVGAGAVLGGRRREKQGPSVCEKLFLTADRCQPLDSGNQTTRSQGAGGELQRGKVGVYKRGEIFLIIMKNNNNNKNIWVFIRKRSEQIVLLD